MKILHIGSEGNFRHHTENRPFLRAQEFVSVPMNRPAADYLAAMPAADLIVADAIAPVSADLIRAMPDLKMIHSEGVAFNGIDLAEADRRGVWVCNCAGMNASAVAEQTILLMLGAIKNVVLNDAAVREGRQIRIKEGYMTSGSLMELADCRVGLIGLGNIGRATARLLSAFGAETFYYKRNRLSETEEAACGVSYRPLDGLLAASDIVSLHLPVTESTRGICGASFLAKMKPGSILVNTSRGELVDEPALASALASGHLKMAALDTISGEPVRPDHFLLNQPEEVERRLLLSPHIGGITASSFARGYAMIEENARRVAAGEEPLRVVNHPVRAAEGQS